MWLIQKITILIYLPVVMNIAYDHIGWNAVPSYFTRCKCGVCEYNRKLGRPPIHDTPTG